MNHSSENHNLKPGDIITKLTENGDWTTIKILLLDECPDGSTGAHCLTYQSTPEKPTRESADELTVSIHHMPINVSCFNDGWELLENQPVVKDDLFGFIEYLKLTDFPRYIDFTGQDTDQVLNQANEYYQRAYNLGTEEKHQEAITEYTKAIECFPLFYEAIDNRAFSYMDLGDYQNALYDFEESLRINPDGPAAFFSKGECLLKLGNLKEAEEIFSEGLSRFPAEKEIFAEFLHNTQSLRNRGS